MNPYLTLKIGIQLVKILETLHLTGYTHNDIKPDNIMIHRTKHTLQKRDDEFKKHDDVFKKYDDL